MTYTTSRNWPADWRSGRWSGALFWISRVWGHETETHSKRQPNSQVKVPFEDPAVGWHGCEESVGAKFGQSSEQVFTKENTNPKHG